MSLQYVRPTLPIGPHQPTTFWPAMWEGVIVAVVVLLGGLFLRLLWEILTACARLVGWRLRRLRDWIYGAVLVGLWMLADALAEWVARRRE